MTMEPKIIERKKFTVMGVLFRFTPQNQDFGVAWKRFMEYGEIIKPYSTDGACYGVDYMPNDEGIFEYIAGMAVGGTAKAPEGLILREVLPALDAVFESTVGTIGQTYDRIHEWLRTSEFEHDEGAPNLERYPPETRTSNSPVFLHVPVRKRR